MTAYEKFVTLETAFITAVEGISQSARTAENYRRTLDSFKVWLADNSTAEQTEITPLMVVRYSQYCKERGLTANTRRHYLIVLQRCFGWGIEHKLCTEKPVLKTDIPKKERIEYHLLSEDEIAVLLEGKVNKYAKQGLVLRNRAMITMFLQTGVRVSELINLRISDLDFERHTVQVVKGKGDKFRYTTFPPLAEQRMRKYLDDEYGVDKWQGLNEYAFTSTLTDKRLPYTRQNVDKIIKAYCEPLLGRRDIGAHSLRHCYASTLLTNGAGLEQIQKVLGHNSYATTVIYASHLCPQRIGQDLNRLFN